MRHDADRSARFEPRVLWDQVGVFDATDATQVRLNRDHLRNGEDSPYVLTHMLVAPVGLVCRRGNATVAANAAVLSRARIWVKHPDVRKVSREYEFCGTLRAEQSGTPNVDQAAYPNVASLFGTMAWLWDRPVRVPPMVQLYCRVTPVRRPVAAASSVGPDVTPVFFQEDPVNGRLGTTKRVPVGFNNGCPGRSAANAAALGCAADALPTPVYTVWSGGEFYRSPGALTPIGLEREGFDDRLSRRPSYLSGFSILVDQLTIDASTAGAQVNAPLGNAMGISLGSSQGDPGVKHASTWWRGLPPLSLVTPTINDIALVHRLPEPIRLQRGQALDVSVELCRDGITDQTIGVSFCGYTELER